MTELPDIQNVDMHWFYTRDGRWAVRVETAKGTQTFFLADHLNFVQSGLQMFEDLVEAENA